jgi:hypothetical protein
MNKRLVVLGILVLLGARAEAASKREVDVRALYDSQLAKCESAIARAERSRKLREFRKCTTALKAIDDRHGLGDMHYAGLVIALEDIPPSQVPFKRNQCRAYQNHLVVGLNPGIGDTGAIQSPALIQALRLLWALCF